MSLYETLRLAIQNIVSSKLRTFLTMLGIIIGVTAVIVIVGLGNGMQKYMADSFASLGTNSLTVNISGRGSSRNVSEEEMYEIAEENASLIAQISPTVSIMGIVKIGNESYSDTTVTGVSEDYFSMKDYEVSQGRGIQYADILDRKKVCVVGSYVSQYYFDGNAVGQTLKVNGNKFKIVGVMGQESDEMEEGGTDDCVFLPYSTAARISFTGTISTYTLTVADENYITQAVSVIEAALYDIFNDSNAYSVMSLSEMLDTMNSMINMVIMVLAVIAGISLLVGGIGIMNIMLVSVTERTREIGIRKALGAREGIILRQFVIESAVTSGLGGILGIVLGILLCRVATSVVTMLTEINMTVSPSLEAVLMAFGISAAIGVFFGWLPAKKAAQLNPIDALRYD